MQVQLSEFTGKERHAATIAKTAASKSDARPDQYSPKPDDPPRKPNE
jgi:hypothetical protein